MMRWLTDTLGRRLFLLMWAALVGSHVLAFTVDWLVYFRHQPMQQMRWPVFPSLPPSPGLTERHGPEHGLEHPPGPPSNKDMRDGPPHEGAPPMPLNRQGPDNGMPPSFMWLDYGVRLFVIALAAWWGSRWLAGPIERLSQASEALGENATNQPLKLDETNGTRELRNTARVFNAMAARLKRQFSERSLLVAALSHDLRTPLTRLRMRLESVGLPPEAHQRSVNDIAEMNTLINSALELFRNDFSGNHEPRQNTDVSALLLALVDDLAEQGCDATFSGEAAVVSVQPVALRRAFSNLIANALRYGQRAAVRLELDQEGLLVFIDDSGPGIPQEQLESVFQPFYRLESSRSRDTGGAGLGLYIARELIQGQGCTLNLSNRPEGGLRATVRIRR